jgi:2,3,4,5-tetrahydropyridine-2-carboxylate N-succinyltransferase
MKENIERFFNKEGFKFPLAYGFGLRRKRKETTLDVFFPELSWNEAHTILAVVLDRLKITPQENICVTLTPSDIHFLEASIGSTEPFHTLKLLNKCIQTPHAYLTQDIVLFCLFTTDAPVESTEEGYFKLHAISHRLVKPHTLTLDGLFGKLPNVAWTNRGPILPDDLAEQRLTYWATGIELQVSHIDKFPYLVNYHIPSGVRIASGSQVRLGAYLGEGTTVMPAGYINFNAGTQGYTMVEGRISGGVMVGKNSDIGGGASIMGTLSGGNKHVISIGEKCLIGANAGTGISLGYGCTIAAGLYIYAGMKISLYDKDKKPVDINGNPTSEGKNTVKALELSGKDHLLFIQDSQTGKTICIPNQKTIELNSELHKN